MLAIIIMYRFDICFFLEPPTYVIPECESSDEAPDDDDALSDAETEPFETPDAVVDYDTTPVERVSMYLRLGATQCNYLLDFLSDCEMKGRLTFEYKKVAAPRVDERKRLLECICKYLMGFAL